MSRASVVWCALALAVLFVNGCQPRSPHPGTDGVEPRSVRLTDFAGRWLAAQPDLEHSAELYLEADGDRVKGVSSATQAQFNLRLQGDALVGTVTDGGSTTPVRLDLTFDKKKLVLSVLYPQSEPDLSVWVRIDRPVGTRGPRSRPLTPEEAIAAVRNVPEVQVWMRGFQGAASQRVRIEVVGREGPVYTVHVYEKVPADQGGGTATQGWYEVDKQTGRVHPVGI